MQLGARPQCSVNTSLIRAVMLDVMAQAVRNGTMQASLPEMQREAKVIAGADPQGFDGYLGIRLLGIRDSVDEIGRLKDLWFADDPTARRSMAIEALGYICDPRAKRTLEELIQAFPK
jgi:hypothetical protein